MADDDDDPQLRSMRAAWRSLPDEDPPERGLAELMAAARQQAEVMADTRTPWWKRAMATMLRPPMLALASVLVLLGGVFVVTSSHKGVSPEPTPVEDQRAAPAVAPITTVVPVTGGEAAAGSAAAPPEPPPPVHAAAQPKPTPPAPTYHTPPAPTPKRVAPASHAADKLDESFKSARGSRESLPPPPPPAPAMAPTKPAAPNVEPQGAAAAPDDTSAEELDQTRAPVAKKAKASPAPAAAAPAADGNASPRRQLDDQLLAQCRAAAVRGDCESAKRIAQRIATDDAAYYNANVTSDAAIAKCLGK